MLIKVFVYFVVLIFVIDFAMGQLVFPTLETSKHHSDNHHEVSVRHIKLDKQNIDKNSITLSGFSSGGGFAQIVQFSYSSLFRGIAVFSHTYYRCGLGDGILANFDDVCTALGPLPKHIWNPKLALKEVYRSYKQNLIEDPKNLKNKYLYVFAGTRNPFFTVDQSMAILNIYEPFIRNNAHIRTRVKQANSTLPSLRFGVPCVADSSSTFFISSCDLSGPFDALNFLLQDSVTRAPLPGEFVTLQSLRTFDQSEFFYGVKGHHDMDKLGFLYIPKNCHGGIRKCLLHLYFHGCSAGREFLGEDHIRNSGFLEVAELNNIITIFPQVFRSNHTDQNVLGCWDVYGYTGPHFATQRGAQVTVVRNILARVLGEDQNQGWNHVTQNNQGQSQLYQSSLSFEYESPNYGSGAYLPNPQYYYNQDQPQIYSLH